MPSPPALYTDENVDGALVRALRRLGWDVARAVDLHPMGTHDEVHFQTAAEEGRALVSHDTDLLTIAAEWQAKGKEFPGMIFYHPDKFRSVGETLRALASAVAGVEARPLRNRVHFL